jgi:hypothetical protein
MNLILVRLQFNQLVNQTMRYVLGYGRGIRETVDFRV